MITSPRLPYPKAETTLGALKVVFTYAIFATLWILLSDEMVGMLVKDPRKMVALSIVKGGVFVLITALLLFVLVWRFGSRLAAREEALALQRKQTSRVEKSLKENEEMFKALAEGAGDAFLVHDPQGRFMAANARASESLGYSHDELLRMGVEDVDLEFPLATLRVHWAQAAPGASRTFLSRHTCKDGTVLPVEVRTSTFDFNGQKRFLAVVRDMTELERAAEVVRHAEEEHLRLETELAHAQKLESLGGLASGIAHNMNNVLAAIQSMTEVMTNNLASDTRALKGLETILKATHRGRDLVKALGDFARRDLQAAEALDLNQVVQENANRLDLSPWENVAISLELEAGLPSILGERGPLDKVFRNLVTNALDAMPKGGTLSLRTRSLGEGKVELGVADTGAGMPSEILSRAMEPFFTTKAPGRHTGLGLGLAMVHGIVKAHGGTLQLRSEVGSGTAALVALPVLSAAAAGLRKPAAPPPAQGRPLKVLLIDDDELIRDSVPPMLELYGHSTVTASSASMAMGLLEKGLEVDLAILDLNMPEMDGAEALGPLRALRPHLPVLIATGFLDARTEESLRRHTQVHSLSKPFTMDELERSLKVLCP